MHHTDNPDILIKVDGISKKFCKSLKRSLLYGARDIAVNCLGKRVDTSSLRNGEFWSVDSVSFEVKRGECLGLIGPNGAGKSTLLKMLNGIFPPDKGTITVQGRVGALIEIGAGFHPMLTGRENIYIAGAINGLTKKEVDHKFDQIVEFAEIKEFINMPIKFYSSGMYVRLGFAVAAQMRPDVLLIDEVLAVGDVGFRAKCYNYVSDINKQAAVIFVSHSMPQISRICDRVIVLNHGKIEYDGDVVSGIETYHSLFHPNTVAVAGTGEASVYNFHTSGHETEQNNQSTVSYGEKFSVDMDVEVDRIYPEYILSVNFLSQDLQLVAQCHSRHCKIQLKNTGARAHVTISIPELLLNPGKYIMSVVIYDKKNRIHLYWNQGIKILRVVSDFIGSAPVQWNAEWIVR